LLIWYIELIPINRNILATTLVVLSLPIINLGYISSVIADSDYCYDKVGDGHHCFERENRCEKAQKHDGITKSHCYKEDWLIVHTFVGSF